MNLRNILAWWIGWALLGTGLGHLHAQTNLAPSDADRDRTGRIVTSDQVDQALNLSDASLLDMLKSERPEYPKLSPEVQRKLLEFKRQRDRYLREQERLIKQYKGATDAERDLIRDRLKERRQEWMERSRSFRETARERVRDLIRELPKHQEALDAARDSAREQVQEIRQRPRTD